MNGFIFQVGKEMARLRFHGVQWNLQFGCRGRSDGRPIGQFSYFGTLRRQYLLQHRAAVRCGIAADRGQSAGGCAHPHHGLCGIAVGAVHCLLGESAEIVYFPNIRFLPLMVWELKLSK